MTVKADGSDPVIPASSLVKPVGDAAANGLVYQPFIKPHGPATWQVRGQREDSSVIVWGVWGGLMVLVVGAVIVASAQSVYTIWDILWAGIALGFGLLLYRYGDRSSLRGVLLCEVDTDRQAIFWPTTAGGAELAVAFDEITEVIFGMTDYAISESREDVQVHAFTLLVRDADERLIPLVEATPHKGEAHTIATILANQLDMGISYVGEGI